MQFDYDSKKDSLNKQKHGIDFQKTTRLWDQTHVVIPAKNVEGENRYAILGKIDNKVYVAIFTMRDEVIRIISCHRADKKLEKIYAKLIKEKEGR